MVNGTGLYPAVGVEAGEVPAVGPAGARLLTGTVRATGLDTALSRALAPWRRPLAVHDPGKIIVDLALCAFHVWLAAVVENQLVGVGVGLIGSFIGVYMLLAPAPVARLVPWGYYAVITPAKVSMVDGHGVHEYVQVPMGWIVGFLVLTAAVFTVATRRLDRIER